MPLISGSCDRVLIAVKPIKPNSDRLILCCDHTISVGLCNSGFLSFVSYVRRDSGMAMTDFTAIQKLVRAFDVPIEDLVEVLED